jgi:hypothetical protein
VVCKDETEKCRERRDSSLSRPYTPVLCLTSHDSSLSRPYTPVLCLISHDTSLSRPDTPVLCLTSHDTSLSRLSRHPSIDLLHASYTPLTRLFCVSPLTMLCVASFARSISCSHASYTPLSHASHTPLTRIFCVSPEEKEEPPQLSPVDEVLFFKMLACNIAARY